MLGLVLALSGMVWEDSSKGMLFSVCELCIMLFGLLVAVAAGCEVVSVSGNGNSVLLPRRKKKKKKKRAF